MTAQLPDTFQYQALEYAVAGIAGPELFDPLAHGLAPFGGCTALWRGFCCTYALENMSEGERVVLAQLSLYHQRPPPVLNGVTALEDEKRFDGNYHFDALNLPLEFTGSLLLARGFLKDLYVHMGFHPAWKYETVLELDFVNGFLLEVRDRSEKIAEMRGRMLGEEKRAIPKDRAALEAWIEETFDRGYGKLH